MGEREIEDTASTPDASDKTRTSTQRSTGKSDHRRTWDLSAMTQGSPFRRLSTPARRPWRTPTLSQRVSILSSSVDSDNSAHNTTRSVSNSPAETDDVVQWIHSMKLKAKSIIHAEEEEEKKFYEELERDKRMIETYNDTDSEAFEKLKVILEGKAPEQTHESDEDEIASEQESEHESLDEVDEEEYDSSLQSEEEEDERVSQLLNMDESEIIDLSDINDEDGDEAEASYNPDLFKDDTVSYTITPQYESMYARRVPQENPMITSQEAQDSHQHNSDHYAESENEEYEEEYEDEESGDVEAEELEGERVESMDEVEDVEEVEEAQEIYEEYEELEEVEAEESEESEELEEIEEVEAEEVNELEDEEDEEQQLEDEDEEDLEFNELVDTESEIHSPIEASKTDDDNLNMFTGNNFELLASAALTNTGYANVTNQSYNGSFENLDETPQEIESDSHVDEMVHGETLPEHLSEIVEITESSDAVNDHTNSTEPQVSTGLVSNTDDEAEDDIESKDQTNDIDEGLESKAVSNSEALEDEEISEPEEEVYYDSDNEPYRSPSHSMFGDIREEDLSVFVSDVQAELEEETGPAEELDEGVEEAAETNITRPESPEPSDEQREEIESEDESDNEIGDKSFVSFFESGPARAGADSISFADVSQQFFDSLQDAPSTHNSAIVDCGNEIVSRDPLSDAETSHIKSDDQKEQLQQEQEQEDEIEEEDVIQVEARRSILQRMSEATEEYVENALGETPDTFVNSVEDGVAEGLNEISRSIPQVAKTIISDMEEMEKNGLGDTAEELVDSITEGLNEIGPSITSAVESTLKGVENYDNALLGETPDEFTESVKEGLSEVSESAKNIATAVDTFSSAISGDVNAEQEQELLDVKDEFVAEVTDAATGMFETALGESGLDLVTAVDDLIEESADSTVLLGKTEPVLDYAELLTTIVPPNDKDIMTLEGTSTPIKPSSNEHRSHQNSNLNSSLRSDSLTEGNKENLHEVQHVSMSDRIEEYLGNATEVVINAVETLVETPVEDNVALLDNTIENNVNSDSLSITASKIVSGISNASNAMNEIVSKAIEAPDLTLEESEEPLQDPVVSERIGSLSSEVEDLSRAASVWYDDAFGAPDETGHDIEETVQNGPSLLKRGWNALRGWTSIKRAKKSLEADEGISQTPQDTKDEGSISANVPGHGAVEKQDISNSEEKIALGTEKKRRYKKADLDVQDSSHIVMKTRSGRYVGANTAEKLEIEKRREEEEQKMLSDIIHGDVDVPPSLLELAVESQEVTSPIPPKNDESDHDESDHDSTVDGMDLDTVNAQDEPNPTIDNLEDYTPSTEKTTSADAAGSDKETEDHVNATGPPEEVSNTSDQKAGIRTEAEPPTSEQVKSLEASEEKTDTKEEEVERTLRRSSRNRKAVLEVQTGTDDESVEEYKSTKPTKKRKGREGKKTGDVKDGKVSKPSSQSTTSSKPKRKARLPKTSNSKKNMK